MRLRLPLHPLLVVGLALAPGAAVGAQAAPSAPPTAVPAPPRHVLFWPTDPYWRGRAPDSALVDVVTSRGTITIQLRRAWAPAGVDRAYLLARAGYFDDSRVHRVVPGFVAQFGIAGDPAVASVWARADLPPDVRRASNVRGTVTFAQRTPNDRTTNLFINLGDNARLDALGFVPVGRVVRGMAVADRLYGGYGERPMAGENTRRVYAEGNAFFDRRFPKLDRIRAARVRR